ncbi:TA system antitoxin ParD family protein [Mycobacteroides abscessus]|uniref:TA system antitoxin ParD family protein n=1 Tax=Mycobacteroides abscessus TaxID=36809 RepID=UPI0009A8701C|nr:hypothetical protein [Mycobacteroides abscessus]MBN7374161.1 hypothetical protein [Mycobacteroides abscessus subsp. abscessus]RIR16425.1 hypothetical protein D2E41_26205 [Mycobacteroides abscessus]SLJ67893.1 Protein of uncharacterised function (DUF3423) [Mycobacteroides abscessus subsp. abscessus]
MTTASRPTRVDEDLWNAAVASALAQHRSAVQQINRWIRIGRELEASPGVSQRDIQRVLVGDGTYDDLSEREQAIVRAEWDQRIAERRDGLDLEAEFAATGQSWSESDDAGNLIIRGTTS